MSTVYPDADRPTVFKEALKFQDFVVDLMLKEFGLAITNYSSEYYQYNFGENRQGIEIKLDKEMLHYGNVSIEVAEKTEAKNENWIESGILRNDNSWLYIQGNYDIVFIFGKEHLKRFYKEKYFDKVWQPKPTIKTFRIPIKTAEIIALKVIRIKETKDVEKE